VLVAGGIKGCHDIDLGGAGEEEDAGEDAA